MLWIIGSIALALFGIIVMCILILGGRVDDLMESTRTVEPSTRLPFSAEHKVRIVLQGF